MFTRSRFFKQNVWFAGLSLVLGAALALAGCSNSNNDVTFAWISGTWNSAQSDGYVITGGHLSYGYSGTISYQGNIQYVEYFTPDSGVIIFEYDANGKPQYYEGYDENYNPIGNPQDPPGDFIAVYFKNLTASTGQFATAYDASKPLGCEVGTLAAAKDTFTLQALDSFVSYWGGYTKQQ